jgi:hypothetical protein
LRFLAFILAWPGFAKRLIRVPVPIPLDALKAAIAGGEALLVCGAGVSRAVAGDAAKGWKGLIESAIDEAPKEPGEDWARTVRRAFPAMIPTYGSAQQTLRRENLPLCGPAISRLAQKKRWQAQGH